jgi:dynactin complex subunit
MHVGQRVSYGGELCTIRDVGEVDGTKGEWLGVEWDDPTRGKHNGEAGGRRYFECTISLPSHS